LALAAQARATGCQIMESNRPPPGAQHADPPPVALQRMLGQCTQLLQRELPALVDDALQRVDDALYEFADKAESDHGYASYFEAQRHLRHQRGNLKRRFLRNLTDTVVLFQDASHHLSMVAERSFDSEELQILGEKDLEESLVLANMISKAETRYLRPLRDLTRHFAQLLRRPELRQRDIPVSPTAIANAFAAALRSVDELDLSTVLFMHKIFDQQVMDRLDAFYAGCVDFALAQGLSPAADKHEIVKSTERGARTGAPAPADAAQQAPSGHPRTSASPTVTATADERRNPHATSGGSVSATAGAAGMFEALRQMLAGTRQADAASSSLATLATDELIALLSRVQPQMAWEAADTALEPSILREVVGDRLRASMDPAQPSRLAPSDEDTMDLVFLLFEQLLASADMPDAIKVLVSRLQIPYVKLALVERDFFDAPQHPARRLLNAIAKASIGWNDSDRDQVDGLYAHIDHLVQRIITESHTDPELFTKLANELDEELSARQTQAAGSEQRVVQQAAARNARQSARRQALGLVEHRAPRREDLPPVVRTILDDGWIEAMVQAHADGGEQNRRWRIGERVLDDLLWSVAPKRDASERRELLRRIPELLRDLRHCLGTVIDDQQLLARWLKELQTVHIAALRGQPDGDGRRQGSAESGRDAIAARDLEPATNDADALPIGCWLGVARDDGSIHRFKLAWRGDAGDPLLFVDHRGRKGLELPRPELDALLSQELATVIGTGDTPLVDRAMEAVRQSLAIH
jgi:hypothetical protein